MANMGRRPHPERKRTVIFALAGAAFAGAACAGQPAGTAPPQGAGIVALQAAAPGGYRQQATADLTPLGRAALYGDVAAAERQLGEGADVDANSAAGLTPLMLCFRPLILPPSTSGEDPDAFRAYRARQVRKLWIARLLLDRGADPARATGHGMTALHYLALMRAEEPVLIKTLHAFMAKAADPNVANSDGMTPLMFAAQRNSLQLVRALISAGADPKAAAKDGRTALSIARERGHAAVAEAMEN